MDSQRLQNPAKEKEGGVKSPLRAASGKRKRRLVGEPNVKKNKESRLHNLIGHGANKTGGKIGSISRCNETKDLTLLPAAHRKHDMSREMFWEIGGGALY